MKSEAFMLINKVKVRDKGCSLWCQVDHSRVDFAHERKDEEACEVILGVLVPHQTAWLQVTLHRIFGRQSYTLLT